MINKDTLMFGSFSKSPGNRGCSIFNSAFKYHGIDAIYKSYCIDNISDAVAAAKTLGFGGFAVSMPFKHTVIDYVDKLDYSVSLCDAANTIVNNDGILTAYNTDYLAAKDFLIQPEIRIILKTRPLFVLGNGGYAAAVLCAIKEMGLSYTQIDRSTWNLVGDIREAIVYNCTPVSSIKLHENNVLIDCLTYTETGRKLGLMQASHQYFLYTGKKLPFSCDS